MTVDPNLPGCQVIIIANTRELIRQVQQVLLMVGKNTNITIGIGDQTTPTELPNIVVTVPQWLSNRLSGKSPIQLPHLKLLVFDEADEIFLQEANQKAIQKIN